MNGRRVSLPPTGRGRVVFGNTTISSTEDEGTLYFKDFLTLKLTVNSCDLTLESTRIFYESEKPIMLPQTNILIEYLY